MTKIYFAGSITGGKNDTPIYLELIDYLKNKGQVLTEHIFHEEYPEHKEIHDRDIEWLNESDFIIAEVTQTSMGVGYEIGRMVERNNSVSEKEKKKILCLYRPNGEKKVSSMILGCDELKKVEYETIEQAKLAIDEFFIENLDIHSSQTN